MNHTPGPWGYESSLGLILSNEGKVIADPIQGVADARLIAAAPEMYDLLDDAMTELASIVNNYELTEEDTRDAIAVCKKFDALWRRIKGEEDYND